MTHVPPAPPPAGGGAHGQEPDLPQFAAPPPPQELVRPRRRTGLVLAIVAAVVVVLCSGCLVGGYLLVDSRLGDVRASASPPAPVQGGCVQRTADGITLVSVKCSAGAGISEVLEMFPPDPRDAAAIQSCPPQSDEMTDQAGKIFCLRSTGSTHPGSPGAGGGVVVPGDCVTLEDYESSPTEVSCATPGFDGKVLARVEVSEKCAAPAVRYAQFKTPRQPVVCLKPGPGFAGPGQCIHTEHETVTDLAAVSCAKAAATMKVLALKPTGEGCPDGTTNYLSDDHGLVRTKVICLTTIKGRAS